MSKDYDWLCAWCVEGKRWTESYFVIDST